MPANNHVEPSFFIHILQTLEAIQAPYMIVGAFAATLYGVTRVTYDIDIVVDLSEEHIEALEAAYPLPRYYADPVQMRDSIRMGILFNLIDTERGEKADLIPLKAGTRDIEAFQRRVRQRVDLPDAEPFEVWCARADDVVVGKLRAWAEAGSRRHETDIHDMMVWHYLGVDPEQSASFDEGYVDAEAAGLGTEAVALWEAIKKSARQEASRTER